MYTTGLRGTIVPLAEYVDPEFVPGRELGLELCPILGAELCLTEALEKLGRLSLRLPNA